MFVISPTSLPCFEIVFRAYLVIATSILGLLGYPRIVEALGISYVVCPISNSFFLWIKLNSIYQEWNYNVSEMVFTLIYVLNVVICFAVGVMLTYHLYEIAYGETGMEAQDNEVYRRQAKDRNEVYDSLYYKS